MHHIIMELPYNLPAIMIKIMQEASLRAKSALPYRMFLTLVFKEVGVNLEEEPSRNLKYFDTYNKYSLRRMGHNKIDNHWYKKGEEREEGRADFASKPLDHLLD